MGIAEAQPQQGPHVGTLLADRFLVEEVIGRGGMGIVVRARDKLTGGEVAVKHVRPDLAEDPDYADRQLREAQLARDVSHHNICRVHDVYRHGNEVLLSMEYVHGETLRRRLDRGPLSPREALHIARQICAGVAAAHDKGVVHRDLKPENVLIDETGRAVVLDFGVARKEGSPRDTVTGIALGTPRYMAPEQQQGKAVCPATDVFALGLLIEELHGDHTPAWLRPIVRRATERDPRRRYQNAAELGQKLHRPWLRTPLGALAIGSAAAAVVVGALWANPPAVQGLMGLLGGRALVAVPPPAEERTLLTRQWGGAHMGTISPDGKLLAYLEESGGAITGVLRPLGEPAGEIRRFGPPKTSLNWLSFSPDSKSLAFSTGMTEVDRAAQVYITDATLHGAGEPRRIVDGTTPSWLPDGQGLVFSRYSGDTGRLHLSRVALSGDVQPVTIEVDPPAAFEVCPAVSPDGRRVAYMAGPQPGGLRVAPLGGGRAETLDPSPLFYDRLQWTPDSRSVLFPTGDGGIARIEADGGSPRLMIIPPVDLANSPSLSADGQRLIFTRSPEQFALWTADRRGQHEQKLSVSNRADYLLWPVFSPDGAHVALTIGVGGNEGPSQVILLPRHGGGGRPLFPLRQGGAARPQCFTPDGTGLILNKGVGGGLEMVAVGPGPAPKIAFAPEDDMAMLSPDGQRLATVRVNQGSVVAGLWVRATADAPSRAELWVEDGQGQPAWSPDGKTVAVVTKRGWLALSVGPAKEQTRRLQLTDPTGEHPIPRVVTFAPDGRLLALLHQRIYDVDQRSGSAQPLPTPAGITNLFGITVSPDNQQIVYVAQPRTSDVWLVEPAGRLLTRR